MHNMWAPQTQSYSWPIQLSRHFLCSLGAEREFLHNKTLMVSCFDSCPTHNHHLWMCRAWPQPRQLSKIDKIHLTQGVQRNKTRIIFAWRNNINKHVDCSFRLKLIDFQGVWFLVGVQTFTCMFVFEAPKAENFSKANPVKYVWCEELCWLVLRSKGGWGLHLRYFIVTGKQKRLVFFSPPGIFVLAD